MKIDTGFMSQVFFAGKTFSLPGCENVLFPLLFKSGRNEQQGEQDVVTTRKQKCFPEVKPDS